MSLLQQSIDYIIKGYRNHLKRDLVRPNFTPSELEESFQLTLSNQEGLSFNELKPIIDKIFEHSLNTSHPLFMNQLYGHIHEMGLVGDFLAAVLNTSMATYEIAPLMTLIELACIEQIADLVGYDSHEGIFTPGGSFSNFQAMLLAKDHHFPNSKIEGAKSLPPVHIYVSDQAHYSFIKFAQIMGLGQSSIVKVASFSNGSMNPEALKQCIENSKQEGFFPLMIAATAGTTVAGVFDDIQSLSILAKEYKLWLHVDASYGGSLLLVPEFKLFFKSLNEADSIAWNQHKMLGLPFHCPSFLTRHKGSLQHALSTEASYLFHQEDSLDLGQKSMHCGRRIESLKLWLSWKFYGQKGFQERIYNMVYAAREFAEIIKKEPHFELHCEVECPIVLFQYIPSNIESAKINGFNQRIRESIFAEGEVILNYSHIDSKIVLRCVISNPNFNQVHMYKIIDSVKHAAQNLLFME